MADTKIELEGLDLTSYPDEYTSPPPVLGLMNEEDDINDKEEHSKMKEESHEKGKDGGRSWLPFLSVEYYQSYFDVTTSDVFYRVAAGMVPLPYNLVSVISKSPDLYGPFWLCMTLIFAIAISGNLSALFSGDTQWEFHFHEVVVIATVIYTYTWCLPIILWLFLVWRNSSDRYSLIMLQSIYGYSMGAFVPLTLLWVIKLESLRWLLLVFAIILSGTVLVQSLWKPLQNETKQVAMAILGCVIILHSGIAIGFKFYYFGSSLAPAEPLMSSLPPSTPHSSVTTDIYRITDLPHDITSIPPTLDDTDKPDVSQMPRLDGEQRVNKDNDQGLGAINDESNVRNSRLNEVLGNRDMMGGSRGSNRGSVGVGDPNGVLVGNRNIERGTVPTGEGVVKPTRDEASIDSNSNPQQSRTDRHSDKSDFKPLDGDQSIQHNDSDRNRVDPSQPKTRSK